MDNVNKKYATDSSNLNATFNTKLIEQMCVHEMMYGLDGLMILISELRRLIAPPINIVYNEQSKLGIIT